MMLQDAYMTPQFFVRLHFPYPNDLWCASELIVVNSNIIKLKCEVVGMGENGI
jgi:hypothetical protein